jgi:hypothetical protein
MRKMIGLGLVVLFASLVAMILATAQAPGFPRISTHAQEPILDFGDAPDPTYPTLLASDGARHLVDGLTYLGSLVDVEGDGQPDPNALGDDNNGDDEDGGLFTSPLLVGQTAALDVVASTDGALDAWLDFNGDGDWDDVGEPIFQGRPLVAGTNNLTFTVPGDAAVGATFSRLRFSQFGDLQPWGYADNGEVEDYRLEIQPPPLGGWLVGHVTDYETGGQATCTPATVYVEPGGIVIPVDPATGYYGPEPLDPGTYTGEATAPGYSTGSVVIFDIASGVTTTVPFQLSRPVIAWAPPHLISVTAVFSQPIRYTLSITNEGHMPLAFEIAEAGGQDIPWVWTDPISGIIPSGTEVILDVTFHCTRTGDLEGVLEILHNDPCQDSVAVPILLHCEAPVPEGWDKWINGQRWLEPEMVVPVQTSQTITVTDIITTFTDFHLTEFWDPARLELMNAASSHGELTQGEGTIEWQGPPPASGVVTLTKRFHVRPCDWPDTLLEEVLLGPDVPFRERPVRFEKIPPLLWIEAEAPPDVLAGDVAEFVLHYGNNGGYENDVSIRNDFPTGAPFFDSDPAATRSDPDGLWAEWDVGDLAMSSGEAIAVQVAIAARLPASTTLEITDVIYNHLGQEASRVVFDFHIVGTAADPLFDLGDAPDSTNHSDLTMMTYPTPFGPGVPAHFPTVYDPATGLPEGPLHLNPLGDAWLGPWVSPEFDADLLPDGDGPLNIDPPPGLDDQDGFDDGLLSPFVLPHCVPTWFTYTVTITPGAPSIDRYANVWFDWNRDGDWDDQLDCNQPGDAPEWAVQNDVLPAGLPPGTYVLATPSFLPHNRAWDVPIWMRISIAEQPAPLPDDGSQWAIGNGPAGGYEYGETEDYYVQPPRGEWAKWVDDEPWGPDMSVTVETTDTVKVVDVVATDPRAPFVLTEQWNPEELRLRDYAVEPPLPGVAFSETGLFIWDVPTEHPEVITLTKWFHVEPCDWEFTILEEALEGVVVDEPLRPVRFDKEPPELDIGAEYNPGVAAGHLALFTLVYSNTGGFENDVLIRNEFPETAPYVTSEPPADRVGEGGFWVEWDVPALPGGSVGNTIDVAVAIEPTLQPSSTIEIWDWIYDHTGQEVDQVLISFHVREPPPAAWDKWIMGQPWTPGITFTVETSDTIEVVDVVKIEPGAGFVLSEHWNPDELQFVDHAVEPPSADHVLVGEGVLIWSAPPEHTGVLTLTKWFHVEPCTWDSTTLEEFLEGVVVPEPQRRAVFWKKPPKLAIDALYDPQVLAGGLATFTLVYSNTGGYENDVSIRNEFPPEALFVGSSPPASWQAPDGSQAIWQVGDLGTDDGDDIEVTAAIDSEAVPSDTIVITDVIYSHAGEPMDEVTIRYHVDQPQPGDGDLYIKDSSLDDGSVPTSPPWWVSPDIWVRNDGDCTQTSHQNPIAGTPTTICVRVRNRMATTMHNIRVDVFWGSAALGFAWPGGWSIAASAHIASLAGGAEAVRAVPWNTPNLTGHFCLLVRADSPDDPVGSGFDTVAPSSDVQNNNNISMKNVNIVAFPEVTECGFTSAEEDTDVIYLDVVNTKNSPATIDVVFDSDDFPLGSGEIVVEPGGLFGRWTSLVNFDEVGTTLVPAAFPASMEGITMAPYETEGITLTITAEIDERFSLSVSEQVNDILVGGILYLREMPNCIFLPSVMKNHSSLIAGAAAWVGSPEGEDPGLQPEAAAPLPHSRTRLGRIGR